MVLEGAFERIEIVEFDDASGFCGIDWRADIAAARADDAVVERCNGFINGAVVAVVEDEDFRRWVISRAIRMEKRLASVAVSVNCQ